MDPFAGNEDDDLINEINMTPLVARRRDADSHDRVYGDEPGDPPHGEDRPAAREQPEAGHDDDAWHDRFKPA